ncbi:enkurin domain-containing protein 1-like [Lineus longissimus]|uniref:enkurin domain-containing protein 1-like n=1 Tax=Lineus longissimus TaxID=88925 RepID=UPI002B4E1360
MTTMVSGWKSSISGPIPPHPYYDSKSQSEYIHMPPQRIKGEEGSAIATHGHKGTVSVLLSLEGQGVRPSSARTKPPPKDHMKENWRRMRQIQKVSKEREADKEQKQPVPVKALWKSEKYSDVPSRVAENIVHTPGAPRPESRNFLRAHSRSGPSRPPSPADGGTTPRPRSASSVTSSIPSASSASDVELIRRDIDFIRVNGKSVKHAGMRRSPSASMLDDLKKKQEDEMETYRKGVVPKYLDKRQREWKAEEVRRIAEAPDPDCPPGHKKMPNEERKKTLDLLKESEEKLIEQMNHLPVHNDTLRVRMKKQELDAKLAEIEEALKIFTRPKVFVKVDS